MTSAKKRAIAERDDWTCNGCGVVVKTWESGPLYATIDHKLPRDKGGTHDSSNLWFLCNICNSAKGTQTVEEWERSLDFNGSFLRRGFTAVPNSLLDRSALSIGARMTLICLMSFAWRDAPFPGQKRLAEMLGCTDRTVREYLAELRDADYLIVQRRGRGKTNVYRLNQTRIVSVSLQPPEDSSAALQDDRKQASVLDRNQASYKEDEDEEDKPPPEGGASAQTIVAEFVDASRILGVEPPARVIGHVAREVGKLLVEGQPEEVVSRAVGMLVERRLNPATLPSLMLEAGAGPARRKRIEEERQGSNLSGVVDAEGNSAATEPLPPPPTEKERAAALKALQEMSVGVGRPV